MSLISEATKEIQLKEKAKVVESLHQMASHIVTKATKDMPPISDEEYDKTWKEQVTKLKVMMDQAPNRFNMIVAEYIEDMKQGNIDSPKNLISKDTLKQLGVLTERGDVVKNAATRMGSRMRESAKSVSFKDVGATVKPKNATSFFGKVSEKMNTFDPNQDKSSDTFGSAQSLNKKEFQKDKEYRNDMLSVLQDIKRLGDNATNEQRLLADEIKKQTTIIKEGGGTFDPSKDMTAGGAALYDIGKLLLKGVAGTVVGGAKMSKAAYDVGKKSFNTPTVPDSVSDSVPDSVSDAAEAKIVPKQNDNEEVSYIMPKMTAAEKEEADEEDDEYKQEFLETQTDQVELLQKINDNIVSNTENSKDSGGIGSWLKTLSVGLLGVFGGMATIFSKQIGSIASGLLSKLGLPDMKLKLKPKLKSMGNATKNLIKGGSRVLLNPVVAAAAGAVVTGGLLAEGLIDKKNSTLYKAAGKLTNYLQGDDLIDTLDSNWTPKSKNPNRSDDLKNAEKNVSDSKTKKSNDALGAIINNNTVTNNSNPTVVNNTTKSGKSSPRNYDNTLGLYLNSRVIKFG